MVWSWHAPALHHAARHQTAALIIEQAMFLLCGLLMWLSAFGGDDRQDASRSRRAAGVVGLLLTSMHMTLLGALLASRRVRCTLTPKLSQASRPFRDQHLGGAIMLIAGGVAYLAGGLWLTLGLMRGWTLKRKQEAS